MVDEIREKYMSLTQDKREKLVEKLKKEGKRYGVFPLTDLQNTLMYAYLTDKADTSYNIRTLLRFSEKLDVSRLKKTLWQVVDDNPSLRSRLLILNDEYFQVVEESPVIQVPYIEADSAGIRQKIDDMDTGFDLEREYPIKFMLIRDIYTKEYVLIMTAHHIFTDGWSFEIIINEIKKGYVKESFLHNEKKRSCPQIYSERSPGELTVQYWEKYLKGGLCKPKLDKWECRQEEIGNKKDSVVVKLLPEEDVEKIAVENSVSVYAVMLSAYLDSLHLLTNQDKVSTAIAVLNRKNTEELESVGLYATLLPVLSDIKNETLKERLDSIKEEIRNCITYSDMNQRNLINLLISQNNSSEIYNNVFLFSEQKRDAVQLGDTDVWIQSENIDNSNRLQYDVLCSVGLLESFYVLNIEYRSGKISKEFAEKLEKNFKEVLTGYTRRKRDIKIGYTEEKILKDDITYENEKSSSSGKYVKELRDIWVSLLEHDDFTSSDKFFVVGGNSLLSIKLMKRINEHFNVKIKITDIFLYDSLDKMSGYLRRLKQ